MIFISNKNNTDNTNGNRKQTKRRGETALVPASTLLVGQMLYGGQSIQTYNIIFYVMERMRHLYPLVQL